MERKGNGSTLNSLDSARVHRLVEAGATPLLRPAIMLETPKRSKIVKKPIIFALVASLGLAACATQPVFTKYGTTQQEFAGDQLDCLQVSQNTVGGSTAIGPLLFIAVVAAANQKAKQNVYNTCMVSKGYTITGSAPAN